MFPFLLYLTFDVMYFDLFTHVYSCLCFMLMGRFLLDRFDFIFRGSSLKTVEKNKIPYNYRERKKKKKVLKKKRGGMKRSDGDRSSLRNESACGKET